MRPRAGFSGEARAKRDQANCQCFRPLKLAPERRANAGQRRHTFDSRLDLRVTWREVNANTTADQAFAPVGYIAHAEIRDEDKPPLQSGSIATGRGGRML
jgi:hypothetical protein